MEKKLHCKFVVCVAKFSNFRCINSAKTLRKYVIDVVKYVCIEQDIAPGKLQAHS